MGKKFVLITGASMGLGKALAEEYAAKNQNLILVALENEGLDELARAIKNKYEVEVLIFECNLVEFDSVYKLAEEVNSKFEIHTLINNAGVGGTSVFSETSVEEIDHLIMLNVRALSLLTRLFLSNLKRQEKAFVMNIASMASFSPMTFKAVYSASKAYVYYFSRALSEELKNTNVFVSVVHPGPMKTNVEVTRSIEKQGLVATFGGLITPEKAAKIAIRQMEQNVGFIVPGFINKINSVLMRVVPVKFQLHWGYKISSREI